VVASQTPQNSGMGGAGRRMGELRFLRLWTRVRRLEPFLILCGHEITKARNQALGIFRVFAFSWRSCRYGDVKRALAGQCRTCVTLATTATSSLESTGFGTSIWNPAVNARTRSSTLV